MPRFLHTADWQIGRQFSRFDADDAQRLADARQQTVARIAVLAAERQVDAVLVAGDLFDLQNVAEKTMRRLFQSLAAFDGDWIVVPGNHDAALPVSVWTRADELGLLHPRIRVFTQTALYENVERGYAVLGAALTQRRVLSDLTQAFDDMASAPGLVRVGLAHGSVTGRLPEQADGGNPIDPNRVEHANLDYLALGDWHGQLTVGPRCAYSGTPEPDGFRTNDPGQVLEVQIDQPGAIPQITSHAVASHQWFVVNTELTTASDLDTLAERLAGFTGSDVLRIDLSGQVSLADERRLNAMIAAAAAQVACLQVRREPLRVIPHGDELADLGVHGYLADVMQALRDQAANDRDPQQAIASEALSILAASVREQRDQQA